MENEKEDPNFTDAGAPKCGVRPPNRSEAVFLRKHLNLPPAGEKSGLRPWREFEAPYAIANFCAAGPPGLN